MTSADRAEDPFERTLRAAIRAPRVPAGLADRVLARIPRREAETARRSAPSSFWRRRGLAAAVLVAASLVGAAFGQAWLPEEPRGVGDGLARAVGAGSDLVESVRSGGAEPRPFSFGLAGVRGVRGGGGVAGGDRGFFWTDGVASGGGGGRGFWAADGLDLRALPLPLEAGLAALGALLLAIGRGGPPSRADRGGEP